ncbi:MAG TPA: MFS transporter [Candidatus Binataceae bacterium]|nr:MFS transporter [Candidatus Binataceae bacterium]
MGKPGGFTVDADKRGPRNPGLLPRWLNRDITLLIALQSLYSLTVGYLPIIIPLYLLSIGYGAVQLGFLVTSVSIGGALFAVASGVASDRFGYKNVIIGSSFLVALGALLFAITRNFYLMMILAGISQIIPPGGSGSGVGIGPSYPAVQALTATHVEDRDRTSALSWMALICGIATAIGAPLAALPDLMHRHAGITTLRGYEMIFILTAALNASSALLVYPISQTRRLTPHPLASSARPVPPRTPEPDESKIFGLTPSTWALVWRFMLVNLTNGLAVGALGPFLTYWFVRQWGATADQLGTLFFIINLTVVMPLFIAGPLTRRFSTVNVVVSSRGLSAIFLSMMPVMPSFWLAGGAFLARQLANAISVPVRQSYIMGVIRPSERASAAGIANLPIQAGLSISSIATGFLMQLALTIPIELSAFFQFLNTLMFWAFFHSKPPIEEVYRSAQPRA